MNRTIQIRLSGAGGQGLITAGVILAEAAVLDGKYVVQTQSYGPEARLGSSKAEVIISDEPIANPQVTTPDVLICLSEDAAAKYGNETSDATKIVIDTSNIDKFTAKHGTVIRAPITDTAIAAGGKMAANVVALGIVNRITHSVSPQSLKEAVANRVPAKFKELNLRALEAADRLAAEQASAG